MLPANSSFQLLGTVATRNTSLPPLETLMLMPQIEVTVIEKAGVGESPSPVSMIETVHTSGHHERSASPTVIVLPTEGGGRGPILNGGQAISTSIIMPYLYHAIDEDQLTPAFLQTLEQTMLTVADLGPLISQNAAGVNQLSNSHNQLSNSISQLSNSISRFDDRISQNYTEYIKLISAMVNVKNDISNIENEISDFNSRITTNASNVGSLLTRMSAAESTLSGMPSQYGNLNNKILVNTNEIVTLKSQITALALLTNAYNASLAANLVEIAAIDDALMAMASQVAVIAQGIIEIRALAQQNAVNIETNTFNIADNVERIAANRTDINALLLDQHSHGLAQEGYSEHNETVLLDFSWENQSPVVKVRPEGGVSFVAQGTPTNQEIICGHGGARPLGGGQYDFRITALLLVAATRTVINLAWTTPSVSVTTPSGSVVLTGESVVTTTTVNCCGLHIEGNLQLGNNSAAGVSGSILLQMKIDGGEWTLVDQFYRLLEDTPGVWQNKSISVFRAVPQGEHTYQFRGMLISDYAPDGTRILNGIVVVDNVTESGSGLILSEDVKAKWTAEEK